MTGLLLRWFVRDYQNVNDPTVREHYGRLSGIVGIVSNLILFCIKAVAGALSGSISILADAVNNLSDSASSVVTLVGFRLSAKPADEEHPYGHARIEYISGLIVAFVILVLGLQLFQTSVGKIINPEPNEFSWLIAAILVVSILVKVWQGLFYRKMGRAIQSATLSATSADSLSDVLATSAVLVGLIITYFTKFSLDGYMGVVVAVFILITGVKVVKETSGPLLGMAPSKQLVEDIYHNILSYDGILGLHDLTVHNYGVGRCFASVHCEVPAGQDIMLSHDIIDNIEREFLEEKRIHLVIHLDPVVTNDERTNALKKQVMGIVHQVSEHMTMHDFRVVWGNTHSNLIFDVCVPFGFSMTDAQITAALSEEVKKLDPTFNTVITVDHSYVPE